MLLSGLEKTTWMRIGMAKKPITDWNKFREQFVRWTLRRASFRWPPRGEALKAARVDRGLYRCASCSKIYGNKEVRVDHIEPVVPVHTLSNINRYTTRSLDGYVLRMFPEACGLQVLCTTCHALKTKGENDARREAKKRQRAKRL